MDLSRPLETLVSPDKASVLMVLERAGQPLTGRTIAALTGSVSQPTVSRLLLELVRSGLVLHVPGGYVLNREHLAYRAIDVLLDAIGELRRRVATAVEGWDARPVSVVLFGSAARAQADTTSDIDLLIVRPLNVHVEDPAWAHDVATLAEQVRVWSGASCDVLEYDSAELDELVRSSDPLIDSLVRDGITFAGIDLSAVLRAAVQ
jgi:predicted nucleotidyltransferase